MKKTMIFTAGMFVASSFSGAMAAPASPSVVYGDDGRIETYQASLINQSRAASAAGMFRNRSALKVGDHTILRPTTLQDNYGLCEGERFKEQPATMMCSGFLVGPDLLVTAGHCVNTQSDCDSVSWAFDFKLDPATGKAPVMLPNKNVYQCEKVVEARLETTEDGGHFDYALIKLDRPVEGRRPLRYRSFGKIALGTDILVIGHPSGLPQKVAGDAKVVENQASNFFRTNLDTFGGNSGSAVFDALTGFVEGILVRGARDYERTESGCVSVHETTQEVTDFDLYGESVSRITDIRSLKYRFPILKAAARGDVRTLKALAADLSEPNVYDNKMNTALHKAAANNQTAALKYLISQKADLDAKNLKGETALHLAAYNNSKAAIQTLLDAGASALVRDNLGALPSQRTMYMALKTRWLLRQAESAQRASERERLDER